MIKYTITVLSTFIISNGRLNLSTKNFLNYPSLAKRGRGDLAEVKTKKIIYKRFIFIRPSTTNATNNESTTVIGSTGNRISKYDYSPYPPSLAKRGRGDLAEVKTKKIIYKRFSFTHPSTHSQH